MDFDRSLNWHAYCMQATDTSFLASINRRQQSPNEQPLEPMKTKSHLSALAIALAITGLSSVASAVTISFSSSEGLQPSNVGTITLTQVNSTTVDVLLDLLGGYGLLNTGGPHTPFAFSISGAETGVTSTFIQPAGGIFSFGLLSLNLGGGSNTPYGTYGIAIDSSAGNGSGNAYYGDLQFQLSRPSGLATTDFIANANGYYFSADLTDGRNTGAQAWKTADPRIITRTPDGGTTLSLMGLALGGLAAGRRFLKK